MKKVFRFLFCTILICAALAEFTSCKKGIPTYDVNPQDIDLADLEWDLDFPYEVFMSPKAAQKLKDFYADFIEAPVSAISDNTYMVILDNLNKYVKTIFKEDVTLYAANDFKVEG